MDSYIKGIIRDRKNITHNTVLLKIETDEKVKKKDVSFFVYIANQNKTDQKPYSPIFFKGKILYFLIKIYRCHGVSEYIGGKKVDEAIYFSTPVYKVKYEPRKNKNILMIAGGTGITPMLQILNNIEGDDANVTLLLSNTSFEDILINKEILSMRKPGCEFNLKIYHLISKNNNDKMESVEKNLAFSGYESVVKCSRLNKGVIQMVEKERKSDFVYVCGPDSFMEFVCGPKNKDKTQGPIKGLLKDLGYTSVYKF